MFELPRFKLVNILLCGLFLNEFYCCVGKSLTESRGGECRKTLGDFHSTKKFYVKFRKFPWASGTEFSGVEHDKPHSFVCVKY